MALVTRRCRDLARAAGVEFVVDTVLRQVVEIGVVTTSRAITITLIGALGPNSRTQQPNLTRRYDVSVDLVAVTDEQFVKGDGVTLKSIVAWPFVVQF